MTRKTQKKTFSATEILEKFVVRARRVREHSLAQDREQLRKYARYESKMLLSLTGEIRIEEELPDEEQFESLAARLRPLLLASESIYYTCVLDAIEELLGDTRSPEEIAAFKKFRDVWDSTDIEGVNVQGYSLQAVAPDGTTTARISDSQLAAGWLYIDLVHVDPRFAKAQAVEHSLKDRFAAATRIFSRVAELALQTLEYLEVPERRTILGIDENVWEIPVTVALSESPILAQVYFAEAGTAPPDFETTPIEETVGWKEFTVTDVLRIRPGGKIAVHAVFAHGEETVDGAVMSRKPVEGGERIEVLLGDCAVFVFQVEVADGQIADIGLLERRPVAQTPDRMGRFARLLLRLHEATSVDFEIPGLPGISASWKSASEAEAQSLKALELSMTDLEVIEQLSSNNVGALSAGFNSHDLRRLRMIRLLWEGKTVWGQVREIMCTGLEGLEPTAWILPEPVVTFGGIAVPTPPTIVYSHPNVETLPVLGPRLENELEESAFLLRAPEGQELIAWSPERVELLHGKEADVFSQPAETVPCDSVLLNL